MNYIKMLFAMIPFLVLVTPAFGGDYVTITGAELKAMIDRNEPGLVIIDTRSLSQYAATRIKGAINMPLPDIEKNPALPNAPKDAKLVFYCSGNT